MPTRSEPAREPVEGLEPSPALSIVENGPESFAGRKLGVLVTDGVDAGELDAVRGAAEAEGVVVALVAPTRHGVTDSAGNDLEVAEKIDGGPSVLFDAVAVLPGADGASDLAGLAPAKDFVNHAHVHGKFIAHNDAGVELFEAAGLDDGQRSEGYFHLDGSRDSVESFLTACIDLRCWDRQ